MAAVVCLDFLPLYFSPDTEVSIGYGINDLHWALPYVFRWLFTSTLHAALNISCDISSTMFCSHALMKHFDYSALTYSQLHYIIFFLYICDHGSFFDFLLALN